MNVQENAATLDKRQRIVIAAKTAAAGAPLRPESAELRSFFQDAHTEVIPTLDDVERSLRDLDFGCYVHASQNTGAAYSRAPS